MQVSEPHAKGIRLQQIEPAAFESTALDGLAHEATCSAQVEVSWHANVSSCDAHLLLSAIVLFDAPMPNLCMPQ